MTEKTLPFFEKTEAKMEEKRESFIFYRSFFEAISELNSKEKLKIYDAICELALNKTDTKLTGIPQAIFTLIKPQIVANTERYENGAKGKEYGKLGGRPKKNNPIGVLNENPKETPNNNVNVNENVNVNANANVSDSCVDGLQKVIDFYNNNIGMITPYSYEILSDYAIILALKKAVEANKRTIQYIKGILNNWERKGIKTVIEAEKEEEAFRNRNTIPEETEEEKIARKIKMLEGERDDGS